MIESFGSWTALVVALPLIQYWVYQDPIRSILHDLIPPKFTDKTRDLLYHACPRLSILDRLMNWFSIITIAFVWLLVKLFPMLPVFDISICLRKRYFYDRVISAITNDGAKQVLVLGGGYDVLATVLAPRYPDVLFVEVDHPSTTVFKQIAVRKMGQCPSNLRFVSIDLSAERIEDHLPDACREWNPDTKSVITAEGLLMYLTPDAVRQCLRSIKAMTGPGSLFVFTYLAKDDLSHGSSIMGWKYIGSMLRWAGEPMRWIEDSAADVESMISSEGFKVDLSAPQSDHYQIYLEQYHKLPSHPFYTNKHGIAIVQ